MRQVLQNFENFGKYILLEKIASGGMAEVYLARNIGIGGITKFVAIKRILPQFSENTEFIDMFKDEAKIAVNLSHSNIVSIYEFGIEQDQLFLVMDYVEGRNLRQILNTMKKSRVSFSIEQVLYIVKEVAAGLDHAHRSLDGSTGKPLNIIHRDMSPQNIMISFEGEVKIIDFGIAKAETQLETTRAGTLKGKFGYMSPEQTEGQAIDLRTDIFSLGIVLWELLANDRLFIANNEINTLRKIRECQVPSLRKINPNIPQELERIVAKALSKDRNTRYQTSSELQKDISRFLNRQFPDFSQHDFGVFIKTMFTKEILETRRKQIEYAKIDFTRLPQQPQAEKTVLIESSYTEHTQRATEEFEFNPASGQIQRTPHKSKQTPAAATAKGPSAVKAPSSANTEKPKPSSAQNSTGGHQSVSTSAPSTTLDDYSFSDLKVEATALPGIRVREHSVSQITYGSYNTRSISHKEVLKPNSFLTSPLTIVLVSMAAIVGTSLTYDPSLTAHLPDSVKHTVNEKLQMIRSWALPRTPGTTHGQWEADSKLPVFDVAITSSPPGAEILIDDVPKRDTTPTNLELERNKVVKISLRLKGYQDEDTTVVVDGSKTVKVLLKPERRGYLDIHVVGSGQIFVDGKKVAESSRGGTNAVPVPADQEVTVEVIDSVTKATDKVKVRVAENRVRKVTLIPRAGSQEQP